ncbi:hypothetical protein NUM3379_40290 [Kineococcus sp. NUM-3379]
MSPTNTTAARAVPARKPARTLARALAVLTGASVLASAPGALAAAPAPGDLAALPGSVRAQLSPAETSAFGELTRGGGVSVDALVSTPQGVRVVQVTSADRSAAARAASLLDAQPGVVTADVAERAHVTAEPDHTPSQWGDVRIGSPVVNPSLVPALGRLVVAVLDTGTAVHPDLPRVLAGANFSADAGTARADGHGHGTHVAGTIAAAVGNGGVNGIADGVTILPVKVLGNSGGGTSTAIAKGIVWAADNGAHVINMSLGMTAQNSTVTAALDYARSKGVVLVAAAGNSGANGNPVMYPAADRGVIGVSATDSADRFASFSEYGPQIDVAAPGVAVTSTLPTGYGTWNGTSMASPHVAAVAALVKAANPQLTPDQVEQVLKGSAQDLGAPGRDDRFGAGLVQAAAAVGAARALGGLPAPANRAPQPGPDSVTRPAGPAAAVTGLLGNDTDADGHGLRIVGVSQPAQGSARLAGGVVSYTPPTTAWTGSTEFSYTVTDGFGATATAAVRLTVGAVAPAPVVTSSAPAGAVQGRAYSHTFTASGTSAVTWSLASGVLPAGLVLNGATGVLSGTPTTAGTSAFSVRAAAGGGAGVQPVNLTVSPAPSPAPTTSPTPTPTASPRPTSSPTPTTSPTSVVNKADGSTSWTRNGVTVNLRGAVRDAYLRAGAEKGLLGWPTTAELVVQGGTTTTFERGSILWSSATGAHVLKGAMRDAWVRDGAERSRLGFPRTGEYTVTGGVRQDFRYGSITLR